jgi:hypothetical protein
VVASAVEVGGRVGTAVARRAGSLFRGVADFGRSLTAETAPRY